MRMTVQEFVKTVVDYAPSATPAEIADFTEEIDRMLHHCTSGQMAPLRDRISEVGADGLRRWDPEAFRAACMTFIKLGPCPARDKQTDPGLN